VAPAAVVEAEVEVGEEGGEVAAVVVDDSSRTTEFRSIK